MEGVFSVIFKKLIDLLTSELGARLFRQRDKFLDALLDLYHNLKLLDTCVVTLADKLDWVLQDFEHHRLSYRRIDKTLDEIRRILTNIAKLLSKLTPGLEIYAEEIVSAIAQLTRIEDFYVNEALPADIVNWAAPMPTPHENEIDWPKALSEVSEQAREVSKQIRVFIRDNYTLERFTKAT